MERAELTAKLMLPPNATQADIEKRYPIIAHHLNYGLRPDHPDERERFRDTQEAYRVLTGRLVRRPPGIITGEGLSKQALDKSKAPQPEKSPGKTFVPGAGIPPPGSAVQRAAVYRRREQEWLLRQQPVPRDPLARFEHGVEKVVDRITGVVFKAFRKNKEGKKK